MEYKCIWCEECWELLVISCARLFLNRGRQSRVSQPSRPLLGPQAPREKSTSPRAAHEASGQVSGHSSPSLHLLSLSALSFCSSCLSPRSHSTCFFLSISFTPTLFTPPSLLSLHLLSVYSPTAGYDNLCRFCLTIFFLFNFLMTLADINTG